jgi:hypothetical protein
MAHWGAVPTPDLDYSHAVTGRHRRRGALFFLATTLEGGAYRCGDLTIGARWCGAVAGFPRFLCFTLRSSCYWRAHS